MYTVDEIRTVCAFLLEQGCEFGWQEYAMADGKRGRPIHWSDSLIHSPQTWDTEFAVTWPVLADDHPHAAQLRAYRDLFSRCSVFREMICDVHHGAYDPVDDDYEEVLIPL